MFGCLPCQVFYTHKPDQFSVILLEAINRIIVSNSWNMFENMKLENVLILSEGLFKKSYFDKNVIFPLDETPCSQ